MVIDSNCFLVLFQERTEWKERIKLLHLKSVDCAVSTVHKGYHGELLIGTKTRALTITPYLITSSIQRRMVVNLKIDH